jgi:putative PIN family toxin of toxin-antitoxin system
MKAVFDTNVFVSAFVVPGSQAERAVVLAQRRDVRLFTSVAILTELANTLRLKFGQDEEDIKQALRLVSRAAEIVRPTTRLAVLDDDPDNRILECALAAEADLVVTGDRHLLRLRNFRGTAMVRLVDLLRLFPAPLAGAPE